MEKTGHVVSTEYPTIEEFITLILYCFHRNIFNLYNGKISLSCDDIDNRLVKEIILPDGTNDTEEITVNYFLNAIGISSRTLVEANATKKIDEEFKNFDLLPYYELRVVEQMIKKIKEYTQDIGQFATYATIIWNIKVNARKDALLIAEDLKTVDNETSMALTYSPVAEKIRA